MPEDHIGTREDWEKAENALADAITCHRQGAM